ncbi:hypothetical protein HYU13_02330 [Candidatus Woesearchaeota archaeon]|nr:hypothetical protein [Candidatus Woesearchaeota archaeon]
MSKLMPKELEVFYLIPALRRELSRIFIGKYKLSQKDIAGILGMTESAISQYLKSKRGSELKFSSEELAKINVCAKKILDDKKNVLKHLYDVTVSLRGTNAICSLHRKQDKGISHECRICKVEGY